MTKACSLPDDEMDKVSGGAKYWIKNGNTYYSVKPGDSLKAIARQFGTTVSQLRFLNANLIGDRDMIKEGWVLRIY
jgi:LysM domain.